jgi:hypothetical protein
MPLSVMALVSPCSSSRLGNTEDMKVRRIVVDVGELQAPLCYGLSLRHSFEFSLMMGNSEAEV